MKILLSPTKKMRRDPDSLPCTGLPVLLSRTEALLRCLQAMSAPELQALWNCSDAIAGQNIERLEHMDLRRDLTPAILSYQGLAFQHMAPNVFTDRQFQYVQEHLRILSGFYGVLRPLDGIQPYRLEMQAPLRPEGKNNLYGFWGRDLYDAIRDDSGIFLDLASREYATALEPYFTAQDVCIQCVFGEMVKGKPVQKATFAKMARGEMVRYLAENQIENLSGIRSFDRLGFRFAPELSSPTRYTFLRVGNADR